MTISTNNLTPDSKIVLKNIESNKNIDEKIKYFKQYLQKIKSTKLVNDSIINDIITIYFQCEPKDPIKGLIQTFLTQSSIPKEKCIELFTKLLQNQIEGAQSEENLQVDGYRIVSCLNDLSQNFEVALAAVENCPNFTLPFLNSIINLLLNELTINCSPSRKSEICSKLHNCFQAYIFCVRNSMRSMEEQILVKHIEGLFKICKDLFDNGEIGFETKNIFAMLIVIKNELIHQNNHILEINDDNENLQKRLCLISGVIQASHHDSIENCNKFCLILEKVFSSKSVDNAIIYSVARLILQITKKLSKFTTIENSNHIVSISNVAISISFMNLIHNIETIRHLSKETLKTLIEIGTKVPFQDNLIGEILSKISSLPIELKAPAVTSIHTTLSIKKILENIPDLVDTLIFSINTHKEVKISCYLTLSNKAHNEWSFNDWFEKFINKLIEKIQKYKKNQDESMILSNLLIRCIRKDKAAVQLMLAPRNNFSVRLNLMLLNLAKEEGILDSTSGDRNLWKGIISYGEIRSAMVDIDIEMRLSAIYLIVDTKKVAGEFCNEEIETILYFFENNLNLQALSTKQSLVGIIKKIISRIRCSVQNSIKKKDSSSLKSQFEVLLNLHKFSLKSLKCESNHPGRHLGLTILFNIHELFNQYFKEEIENIWKEEDFSIIYNVLYDPYESNKEKALELMEFIPRNKIVSYSNISLSSLEMMHKSIKPAESLTASYLMIFCQNYLDVIQNELLENDNSKCLKLLTWCEKNLLDSIEKAENSIIVASGSNPIYPYMSSIRLLLSKINFDNEYVNQSFKDFLVRLIPISRRLTKIVEPIVNDASPEGIYPKENIHKLLNEENDEEIRKIIRNTTSQMILLCGWRTIKEVSLLLGNLSMRTAKLCETDKEIFTAIELVDIGDHFLELLINIKHRGAFEQCFSGFNQYCIALNTSNSYELHSLPSKILNNIMGFIAQKDNTPDNDKNLIRMKNLCATRRSAGLPYIIQSLLSSEIKFDKYDNLHYAMKSLLKLARFGNEMDVRIHSLNILRALYRCKELNDVINEYISEGIKCSILGCASEAWAERNSSTLLFSSLMVRTFGVQRNKDTEQIDIKNKMSSKIFFLRYAELYDFFMEQLNQSVDYVVRQQRDSKLYPLLLILNRLFTSPSESHESSLKLVNFIPIVTLCSASVDLKARKLCARFIANVNPVYGILPRVSCNVEMLKNFNNFTMNFKHGRLLEILYLVKNLTKSQVEDNIEAIKTILSDSFYLLKSFKNEIICFSAALDIIVQIFQLLWDENFKKSLKNNKLKMNMEFNRSALFGSSGMQSQLTIIEFIRMDIEDTYFIESININLELQELLQKLQCIILLLCNNENRKIIIDEYEIDSRLVFFIQHFSHESLIRLMNKIQSNENFTIEIKKLTSHKDAAIRARSYELLSLINYNPVENNNEINALLNEAIDMPDDYKNSILKYVRSWIQQEESSINLIEWNILKDFLECSYLVKSSVIDILDFLRRYLHNTSPKIVFCFTNYLLVLLMDDDLDIIELASKVVSRIHDIDQVYISSFAAKMFINFIVENFPYSNIEKSLMILATIFIQEKMNEASQQEESNEFQIFEKSDTNNRSQCFVIKDILLSALKSNQLEICATSSEIIENVSVIADLCKEFIINVEKDEVLNFLERLKHTN